MLGKEERVVGFSPVVWRKLRLISFFSLNACAVVILNVINLLCELRGSVS